MKRYSDSVFSSFFEQSKLSIQYFAEEMTLQDEILVEVKRLDEAFLPELLDKGYQRILFKSDTQGFDHHVFTGAEGLLDKISAYVTEMSIIGLYEGGQHYLETLSMLEAKHFKPTGFFPVSRDLEKNTLIEMDGVFVKEKLLLS